MKGITNNMLFPGKEADRKFHSFELLAHMPAHPPALRTALQMVFLVWILPMPLDLSAQEGAPALSVSNVAAHLQNNLLRITWTDSPDATGPVTVYMSDSPIDITRLVSQEAGGHGVTSAKAPYGTQYYIDEINDRRIRCYYIVASDASGLMYFLDRTYYTNYLEVRIQDQRRQDSAGKPPPLPQTPSPPADGRLFLNAVVSDGGVVVSFTARGENLILYRSVEPLRQKSDVVRAVIVQMPARSPFTDYPLPGASYYYAVVSQEALSQGAAEIIPGENALAEPVTVPLSGAGFDGIVQNLRPAPLPLMARDALGLGGTVTPDTTPLSAGASRLLSDIKRMEKPRTTKKPFTFKEDMNPPANGEEYAFRSVIQGAFARQSWDEAKEQLRVFLSLPRSAGFEARSHFYLGQAYYFLNQPKEGLFEFLLAKTAYPQKAYEWIEACLALLVD
ncbi:MAG: hypothetical protein LBB48_07255 [Treponema sp.]|jgi:hypothetical protein|nr:hypothetical protein [Treponema sp.]